MKKIIVVDGFSSGKFVAMKLYEMGCELIHIASRCDLDSYYYAGFDETIYRQQHINKHIDDTIEFVRQLGADAVIAGAESGVLLADRLNHELGLCYRNAFVTSSARRNKYEMINALANAGLSAARQIDTADWEDASAWLDTHATWPVVLKPLESAGSDGVFICQDKQSAYHAFLAILGTANKLSLVNESVLLQEFLDGTEYVVNFVSLDGEPLVTEIVRYHKRRLPSGSVIYDIDELLDCTSPEYQPLVDYTKQAALVLGIKNGPSHAEVMMTSGGPVLVEIAARTDGILHPDVAAVTTGFGQLVAFAQSLADPDGFRQTLKKESYQLNAHSFNVCLINQAAGVFSAKHFERELQRLPSYKKSVYYVNEGDNIKVTKNVFSQPGTVYLVHKSKEQLWQDYTSIRKMESDGFYLLP
ncbi:acetyl-CoA carboxylase [Yersinia similis]|uniref:ATP-grasp domain-containing protein n=1 Tax=Yersinia similis TaxID=367190 RepID=UPI0005E393D4|nr:ATP-grasp domain-containing protein [Yersinia similis]CNF28323.1 acetyl-CoA carboxylase [Yersinia similis]